MTDARLLEATLNQREGIPVVDLRGEINGFAQPALDQVYEAAQAAGAAWILLNFEQVEYINSTGIALIVGMLSRANNAGIHLAACALSDHYQQIFDLTRLSRFIQVFPDLASALAAIHRQQE